MGRVQCGPAPLKQKTKVLNLPHTHNKMKLKHIAVSLALIGPAFGGSVQVTNNTGTTSQSVVDNAGNPVSGGYAAIGTVDEGALATLSSGSDLEDAFTIFGDAATIGSTAGLIALNGVYNVQVSGDFNSDDRAGAPIYLVLGNGADLASSTEAAILQVGSFPSSEPAVSVINVDDTATLLWGDYSRSISPGTSFGQPIGAQPALALQGIPEPSSSLLIGLAGLTLLIRRKR